VIHVIRKGKGIYRFGTKEFHLSANQAFLISPGMEVVYEADKEDPWEYMWIGFHGYTSDQVIRKIGFTKEIPYVLLDDTDDLYEIIHEMLEASQLTYSNFMIRLGGMYRFFGTLIEKSEMKKVERTKYEYPQGIYVKQAMMYMLSNYSEKIKIDALADQIGITRNYLAKSFQKELGVSPQEFLINLRMEKAAELLTNTSMPINEVATKVGYPDPLAFSKKFKESYGMSPKAYRESSPEISAQSAKGGFDPSYL
jgi:AraC-like DNA-binding protein